MTEPPCGPCELEAEALGRVLVVRDLLDTILWAEHRDPLRALTSATIGLQRARELLMAAGYEPEDRS